MGGLPGGEPAYGELDRPMRREVHADDARGQPREATGGPEVAARRATTRAAGAEAPRLVGHVLIRLRGPGDAHLGKEDIGKGDGRAGLSSPARQHGPGRRETWLARRMFAAVSSSRSSPGDAGT